MNSRTCAAIAQGSGNSSSRLVQLAAAILNVNGRSDPPPPVHLLDYRIVLSAPRSTEKRSLAVFILVDTWVKPARPS